MRVVDQTNGSNMVAYIIEAHNRRPNLIVRKASPSPPETSDRMGTAEFHTLSSKIDVRVHGTPIQVQSHGVMRPYWTYTSPTHPLGLRLRWKSTSWRRSFDFDCESEEDGHLVAHVSAVSWSLSKLCKVEIFGQHTADNSNFLDEVVMVAISLVQSTLWQLGLAG